MAAQRRDADDYLRMKLSFELNKLLLPQTKAIIDILEDRDIIRNRIELESPITILEVNSPTFW
jgi:3-methyladenine DNA glycosylase Tag